MKDGLDYIAIWLPIVCGLTVFMLVGFIIRRNDEHMSRFEKFVRLFLSEGATIKNWGLFLSLFTFCLLLSGILAKLATDASWPKDADTASLRIKSLFELGLGLEILLAISVGAFGAVAFKGQLPGGASFQLNQDSQGNVSQSATGPAPPVPPVPPSQPTPPGT